MTQSKDGRGSNYTNRKKVKHKRREIKAIRKGKKKTRAMKEEGKQEEGITH